MSQKRCFWRGIGAFRALKRQENQFFSVLTLNAPVPRQKRRSWPFICQRFWLTVTAPDCAFKRIFENFRLPGLFFQVFY